MFFKIKRINKLIFLLFLVLNLNCHDIVLLDCTLLVSILR